MVTRVQDILRKGMKGPEHIQAQYDIQKIYEDQRLVTGQVYAPNTLDAHGHFMTAEDLQEVAYSFLSDGLLTSIDVQHDNTPIDATIVESFIARKGDPDFEEGAWVATTRINDPMVWKAVKDGRINGYSFEILTYRQEMVVEFEYSTWYYGFTDPDPYDKHVHPFMVRLDENGEVAWGKTGLGSNGEPAHTISNPNITDPVDGRVHRVHFEA